MTDYARNDTLRLNQILKTKYTNLWTTNLCTMINFVSINMFL